MPRARSSLACGVPWRCGRKAIRLCRRDIDKPKTAKSERKAALSTIVQEDLKRWLAESPNTGPDGWVFPSERLKTAMGSDNLMSRYMRPQLKTVGLGWGRLSGYA